MKQFEFSIKITLQAPILTHTSGSIGFGLDAAMLRDKDDKPVFTGSLIRGNLRHSLEDFNELTKQPSKEQIQKWFGEEATSNLEPNAAQLQFSEYWTDEGWSDKESIKRYRIAIDENTGAVKTGALQVIESPYEVGDTPTFTGTITVTLDDDGAGELQLWLERAFMLIPAIGALKTNGFGKVTAVGISYKEKNQDDITPVLKTSLENQTQLGLRIKPLTSMCFAKPAIGANNHFETESHIPAAAIVAAIAKRIKYDTSKYDKLTDDVLSKIHFTHARPIPGGGSKRPVCLPLSVVEVDKKFHDITNNTEAELINNQAPTFMVDWKPNTFTKAHEKLNTSSYIDPIKQLKIRTAVNRNTGTANDGKLYSMEVVQPDNCEWLSNMSLSEIAKDDRKEIISQLHELFKSPIQPLGKTKASATVDLESVYDYEITENILQDNNQYVVIYLQSAARLLETGFRTQGTNRHKELKDAYKKSWLELSNNTLELSHFFAQQKLEGGLHWWKRFREKHEQNYHPELFTCEGSVFVFKTSQGKQEDAQKILQEWRNQGLPQLANTPGGEDWKTNPWIAANGYGEIALNLKIQEAL